MVRAAALLILSAALLAWFEAARRTGTVSEWRSVAIVALISMPATFALAFLALPLRLSSKLPVAVVLLVVATLALSYLDLPAFANLAKFAAVVTAGWWFLRLFDGLYLAVVIALIIPWVDAYSVWRGPTKSITEHHASVFTKLSIGFVVPGGGGARLGLPDVFFFAIFLACAVRFGLRPHVTWLAMIVGLGVTIVGTTFWSRGGLPALPAISLGFLLPNADLIWRKVRLEFGRDFRERAALAREQEP